MGVYIYYACVCELEFKCFVIGIHSRMQQSVLTSEKQVVVVVDVVNAGRVRTTGLG